MLTSKEMPAGGVISPQQCAAGNYTSTYVDAASAIRLAATVIIGSLGGGAVTSSWLQATDGAGAGAKALSGNDETVLSSPTADSAQILDCNPSDLDLAGGFRYVALRLTVTGGTGTLLAAVVHKLEPKSL